MSFANFLREPKTQVTEHFNSDDDSQIEASFVLIYQEMTDLDEELNEINVLTIIKLEKLNNTPTETQEEEIEDTK